MVTLSVEQLFFVPRGSISQGGTPPPRHSDVVQPKHRLTTFHTYQTRNSLSFDVASQKNQNQNVQAQLKREGRNTPNHTFVSCQDGTVEAVPLLLLFRIGRQRFRAVVQSPHVFAAGT